MMKFFRKYTKHLLAVFMALLLIVWLGGQALQNLFNTERDISNEVIGNAFGAPVMQKELARIDAQNSIGQSMLQAWSMPWFGAVRQLGLSQQALQYIAYQLRREPLTLEEWYLLDTEARRGNVHVTTEQVELVKSSLKPEVLAVIQERQRLSVDQIDQTIRAYLCVVETALRAANAVTISEADIQDQVRQSSEKVKADIVVVDPSKLVNTTYQPTPEELKAQFDKYKDKPAGLAAADYGYLMPEVTQIEYIEVNVNEVIKSQAVADDEAFAYWMARKDEFKQPTSKPATTAPAAATQPASPKPFETFYEARADVLKKIKHEKAARIAQRLAEEIAKKVSKTQTNPSQTQPADEATLSLFKNTIAGMKNNKYSAALSTGRTSLATEEEMAGQPKIGQANAFADSSSPMPFSQLAFMATGLKAEQNKNENEARLFRGLLETCLETVADSAGNVYVFRNSSIRPAKAPETYEQVKAKLIEDVRYVRATAEAERQAKALAEQASKSGLKAAFDSSNLSKKPEKAMFIQPEAFARRGGIRNPAVGNDPELVDLCFDMAGRASTTQPSPVDVRGQKQVGKWFVVEFKKLLPVTRDEYNQQRQMTYRQMLSQRRVMFIRDWFAQEAIMARTGWQDTTTKQSNEKLTGKTKAKQAGAS